MKLYVVMWTNGRDYEDQDSDPVALFSSKPAADRFAEAATKEAGKFAEKYRKWLEDGCDGNEPKLRNKYDPKRSDTSTQQRYIVLTDPLEVNPPTPAR